MLHPMFDNKTARWLKDQGYRFPPRLVVSLSGGKDSTAMVHRLLSWGFPIDALLFFDTGWEFPEMYEHLELMEKKTGLKITTVTPRKPFNELLKRYRWPDGQRRWCSREKIDAITKWINQNFNKKEDYIIHCVGFALDELHRTDTKEQLKKGQVMYPLLNDFCCDPSAAKHMTMDDSMTESDALQYCHDLGYTWGGLYERFSRVSCYCCPLKRKRDLRTIYWYYPDLWERALEMERSIPESNKYVTFIGRESLQDIDARLSKVGEHLGTVESLVQLDLFSAVA
ncbi:MAG: phosphoadenosine phosphosulfate reductase family protein [Desulfobacterium sp.]|nr:phosphoadenosine phosphosulfate reductase family protein [Desulfobacterium sp.]